MQRVLKKFILSIFLLFFAANSFATDTQKSEPTPSSITVGLIPSGNPERLREQGLALAKDLQERLNIPVNIYISKDYVGLIDAMKTKKIDFGFFSSLTFVFAEEQANAKVLLKVVWNEPYYYSAIVTTKASGIKTLKELRNKRIAFVDEKSSSGYLYPQVALRKVGISDKEMKQVVFSGNHQASMNQLDLGKVDAAAVFSDDEKGKVGAWTQFGAHKKEHYKVIWQSAPIPNDPFCVRQDFYEKYPKTTHTLMFSLIEIIGEAKKKGTYSEFLGSRDLMPATSKQYDPVREMVKALNIELKP